MTYVSHARTPEQLKDEVCSYLRMRLAFLDGQTNATHVSTGEKSRLAYAKIELEGMLSYWTEMHIIRPRKSHQPAQEDNTNV